MEVLMGFIRILSGREVASSPWRATLFFLLLLFTWNIALAGEGAWVYDVSQTTYGRLEIKQLGTDKSGPQTPALPQAPGWPLDIGAYSSWVEMNGGAFADLDEDGNYEIIVASGGQIYVWDYQGNPRPGWPQWVVGKPLWGVAVGDVDDDGSLDIAVATFSSGSGLGRTYLFDRDGNVAPGWPLSFAGHDMALCPTLSDLDGDGTLEMIVGERADPIGYLHVLRYDGTEFPGNWPVQLDHPAAAGAAVGDLDNDGAKEIVFYSSYSIYVFESDGTIMPGWPYSPAAIWFMYNSPALADFDQDGDLEIVCSTSGSMPKCFVFDHQGNVLSGWPMFLNESCECPPSIGDIDGDGELEIAVGNYAAFSVERVLHVYRSNGRYLPGFPLYLDGGAGGPIALADIEGDSTLELLFDCNMTLESFGYLRAHYSNGDSIPDWPLRPYGVTYWNGPTVGDVNDDGMLEVFCRSKMPSGRANLWTMPYSYGRTNIEWATYQFDNHRTGVYRRKLNLPPDQFGLVSPDSGVVASLKPTLRWNKATNPDSMGGPVTYTLKYSLNPLFWGYEQIKGLTDTVCILPDLMPDSVYYWRVKADDGAPDGVTWGDQGFWWFRTATYVFGDANGDQTVDPADVVYLLNYLFRNGDPPDPLLLGDPSNDCLVDAADVIYLINYLFQGGPAPLQGCA
jgi:hypothetical protein